MKRITLFIAVFFLFFRISTGLAAVTPRQCTRALVDHLMSCIDTLMDMRSIQTAIEAYGYEHKAYPEAHSMAELRKLIEPRYIQTMPLVDAWGTEFRYVPSNDGKSYVLASAGSDRTFDESTWDKSGLLGSSKDDAVVASTGHGDREWVIQQ